MEELIDKMYSIIKDHRKDEGFMTRDRIDSWVRQFPRGDRIFMLEETINILEKRYISEADGRDHMKTMIRYLTKDSKCVSVKEFVSQSYFIDNQKEGKSQGHLLDFLDEILRSEYDTNLKKQNKNDPKYILYFDDFLCTGETIMKGLFNKDAGWLHEHTFDEKLNNHDYIKKGNAKLSLCYLAMHKRCRNKLGWRASKQDVTIDWHYIWAKDFMIENDPDDYNSALNFIFPTEEILTETIKECQEQIEGKVHEAGYNKTQNIKFRDPTTPKEELLFTSNENRNRYEKIVLKRCVNIYNDADHLLQKLRPRPLGFGLNTEVSFGFGTLMFSWRNVPFNTPLIFWYPHNGCTPLFDRDFT
jgi:hypothetical protein